jgi:hypothetical protein
VAVSLTNVVLDNSCCSAYFTKPNVNICFIVVLVISYSGFSFLLWQSRQWFWGISLLDNDELSHEIGGHTIYWQVKAPKV